MARCVWLVWDGAAYPLVADLLARGLLPHLQRVVAQGFFVATAPPGPNSETPPGLMTLFTGREEPDHGTPGFQGPPPRAAHRAIAESCSGFDLSWLRHPPIWVEAVAQGRTVALAATAFAPDPLLRHPYPWPYPLPEYRYLVDGYRHEVAEAQLVPLKGRETAVTLAERRYTVRCEGNAAFLVAPDGQAVFLPPLRGPAEVVPLWVDAAVGLGGYVARLTPPEVSSGEAAEWLWCSAITRLAVSPPHLWPRELGPFLGAGLGWHYSRGKIGKGPRLSLTALKAVTLRLARFFGDLAVHTLAAHPADLVILYQPALDEIAHQLLADALAAWPQGAAAQAVIAVHREVDRQLGRLLPYLRAEDTLLISSDHGQLPIRTCLRPNVVLRQAGLLRLKGEQVDLAHTRALFHSSGWILINTADRPGGIVPPSAYESTLREVERCLEAAVDPRSGRPLGLRHSRALWTGSAPPPGDLFVWGPPEAELRPHFFGPAAGPPEVGGHHQTSLHESPFLQALLAACGPGVRGVPLPQRNSEVLALVRRALPL
ncbi:MAG: hypothetical protein KatS3mg131_3762 [Candidatus Tectimicrobiota bacterium]|nr:MAG: hypothetical protein KatS3mg131_3762 [Candidatus Tectomicrobia bacterium]